MAITTQIKVSADRFRNQIDHTMSCISSLQSCRNWEVVNETEILVRVMNHLEEMVLQRKNKELTDLQARVILRAKDSIARNATRITVKPEGY